MKKRKLWLTAALLVTILSLIVGCSSNNGNNSSSTNNQASSEPSGNTSSSDPKETPKGEPEKLKVEVFDRGKSVNGETADSSIWTKWIHDQVLEDLNIDVTFVAVPRSQEVDKLNVLMATGDAPDIVFTYDQVTTANYAKSGGLTDVSELLDQYGSDLKQYLGEEVLSYGKFFGKQFAIAAKRAFVGDQSSLIRKDWLDKLGLPVPTTTEEFLETMRAFKEKDPGNTGGKVVPYGIVAFDASYNVNSRALLYSFIQRGTEEEFYAKYDFMMPGIKDGVQFMNQMYNEGLISKDFPLDKDGKKFESDFTNGYVGALTQTGTTVFQGLTKTLEANVPEAEYVVMDAFTDQNGNHPKEMYSPMDRYIMIPKSSKHAEAAVKYLNWMANPDNLNTIVNGFEGEDYNLVNGLPVAIKSDTPPVHLNNRGIDLSIISNGLDFGDVDKNIQFVVNNYPDYAEVIRESLKSSLVDGYSQPHFDRPIEAQIKYGSILKDKMNEIKTKAVTAKPSDFDSVYDSGMKEYMSLGGQALVDERTQVYKDMKAGN
ncbi:extracellular solute-binding protein [Paenibacillus sp. HB172176]|uniref:extracellular solute-binding protein n=1 Tax=Paenibacillus sp. HB172176 TaxID=2493690 RepID=UPI001F10B99D|nr:extracellular solute-binding protein [Paenibacillus sp. HB172176]